MTTVRLQVIKVYDIEIDASPDEAVEVAYGMQTTEIYEKGRLVDVSVDHAEVVGETQRP